MMDKQYEQFSLLSLQISICRLQPTPRDTKKNCNSIEANPMNRLTTCKFYTEAHVWSVDSGSGFTSTHYGIDNAAMLVFGHFAGGIQSAIFFFFSYTCHVFNFIHIRIQLCIQIETTTLVVERLTQYRNAICKCIIE